MNQSLSGKIAVVTGGSSGIGRGTARIFAREGAKVVIADIDVPGGKETVDLIKKAGGEAIFVKTDVTKAAEVASMVEQTVKTFGRLDCAFNNAGVESVVAVIVEATEEEWDHVVDTNLKGVWLCMKYELAQMVKQGSGSIVNTASISGHIGYGKGLPYVASKHGVIGLTKSAMMDYGDKGIRINAVCPGSIRTPMQERLMGKNNVSAEAALVSEIPAGRLGTPVDIGETVVWLCSDAAVYINGTDVIVDGGFLAGHYPSGAK
jgi:NAD(P)-dependent dehydrogenase (short-subunit alcohol dehydrogenase family)